MSIASSIRAPFLRSVRRRLGTAWRAVEESALRRPVSTAFARYLVKNFGPTSVEEVRDALQFLRAFDGRTIAAEDLRSVPGLERAAAALRGAAARAGSPASVDVSIVIPVHNNVGHTLMCLLSVLRHPPRRSFEVIVGDDASSDATQALAGTLGGPVVYLRHAENLGYLRNCNASVARARGRHVVLLNNDTLMLLGSLDALIDLLEADARIGLAGSKLLFGNGRLQEAGGIVWRDASTSNFGRDDDPELPQYNYLKDVDCCAAASVAVRADLWRELGGFDRRYAPAYFEDTDLAFRVREAGFRTVYQPRSVVIHYEAASHGRDETQGPRRHLVENRRVFYDRWHDVLPGQCARGQDLFLARDRSRGRPHVLVIAASIPAPDGDGESRALFERMLGWAKGGVQLALWPAAPSPAAATLQQHGIEVLDGGWQWVRKNGRYLNYVVVGRAAADARVLDRIAALTRAKILRTDDNLSTLALPTVPNSGMDRAT
jgi:GT2 family glycosyltransferase